MPDNESWKEVLLGGAVAFSAEVAPPASTVCLAGLAERAGGALPDDYTDVMRRMDGFYGVIGRSPDHGRFLRLLPCQFALTAGEEYELPTYEPNLLLLGTDGAEIAYLYDCVSGEWVELPFLDFGCQGDSRLERRFRSFSALVEALSEEPLF